MQVVKHDKKDLWYLDSGCSRHMTGDKSRFEKFEPKSEGFVTYGDNNKGRILGSGTIGNGSSFNIKNVLLVEGLKHNLISISQLCDKGFKVVFEPNHCLIYDACGSIVLIGKRVNNVYMLDLHHASFSMQCLFAKEDDTWLWHRRLCHIHMQHFNRLNKKNNWLKVYQNSTLRRIEYVKHAKRVSKPKFLLNQRIVSQLKGLWNCFTWIYLAHLEL